MSKRSCEYDWHFYFYLFSVAYFMTLVGICSRMLYEKLTRKKDKPLELEVRTQELIQLREKKASLITNNPEEKDAIELLFEI